MAETNYGDLIAGLLDRSRGIVDQGMAARSGIQNAQGNQTIRNTANSGLALPQTQLQDQMTSLSGMYGLDSPYATHLKQTLARADAKAGRRSQYGNREVDFLAKMAAQAPQQTQAMTQVSKEIQALNNQTRDNSLANMRDTNVIDNAKRNLITGGTPADPRNNYRPPDNGPGGTSNLINNGLSAAKDIMSLAKGFGGWGNSGTPPGQQAQENFRQSEYADPNYGGGLAQDWNTGGVDFGGLQNGFDYNPDEFNYGGGFDAGSWGNGGFDFGGGGGWDQGW